MKKMLFMGMLLMVGSMLLGCKSGPKGFDAVKDDSGNYVVNGGFEAEDLSAWTITNVNEVTEEIDLYNRATDASSGVGSLHFYSSKDVAFKAEQVLNKLPKGTYKLSCNIQGDGAINPDIYIYAIIDGETYKAETSLNGYVVWNNPVLDDLIVNDGTITIGIEVNSGPGAWGTIDDFRLEGK